MLRLIMNQTSHIMMLVEGTSLSVSQWDEKLRDVNWTLSSSDDHHHWVGVRTASSGIALLHWSITAATLTRRSGTQSSISSWGIPPTVSQCGRVDRMSTESWSSTSTILLPEQLAGPAELALQTCWSCVPTFKLT